MYKAAKVEQRATSDTKWKWKNHHHNSKAVRKRFSIFLFTLHCTFRLYGVSLAFIQSETSQLCFHFSFFCSFFHYFVLLYSFGHPSFNFFFHVILEFLAQLNVQLYIQLQLDHNSNKSLSSIFLYPMCRSVSVCIHFMLHMTERHIQSFCFSSFFHSFISPP